MPSGLLYAVPRHRSCVTVSGAYLCAYGYKLFDGYTLAIPDTSGYASSVGSLPFRCQPDTSACFSGSSMTVVRTPSSNRP